MNLHTDSILRGVAFAALSWALAFSITGSAPAAADVAPGMRTLTISGEGKAMAKPDQATLSAGVITQAKTAAAALAGNSKAMNAVFATLKKFGIPDKSIQTSNFSISPRYSSASSVSSSESSQRIVGYEASNNVVVTVNDLSKLGAAIDALTSSGANSFGGISFGFADPKPLMAKARRDAVADAMDRARTIAQAAGVALGPIQSIEEGGASIPGPRPMMMRAAVVESTPIAPGEEAVTTSVTITYRIQ